MKILVDWKSFVKKHHKNHISFGQSVIINCSFQTTDWVEIDVAYTCFSFAQIIGSLTTIEEVRGSHENGRTTADVQIFRELIGNKASICPNELGGFFSHSQRRQFFFTTFVDLF